MTNPTTKKELLAAALDSRRAFAALLNDIDRTQMETPGVEADWSVKDIVAHVSFWEASMCRWLDAAVQGETPEMPQSDADVDRMNAECTAVNAHKSLDTVLAEFAALEEQIVAAVTAVPAEAFFTPGYYAWRPPENPLWHIVGGSTFWHYDKHTPSIRKVTNNQ